MPCGLLASHFAFAFAFAFVGGERFRRHGAEGDGAEGDIAPKGPRPSATANPERSDTFKDPGTSLPLRNPEQAKPALPLAKGCPSRRSLRTFKDTGPGYHYL